MQYSAVFRDHGVHKIEFARELSQLCQNATGYDHHRNTMCAYLCNGCTHVRVQHTLAGDRAIVIERQYRELHVFSTSPGPNTTSASLAAHDLDRPPGLARHCF